MVHLVHTPESRTILHIVLREPIQGHKAGRVLGHSCSSHDVTVLAGMKVNKGYVILHAQKVGLHVSAWKLSSDARENSISPATSRTPPTMLAARVSLPASARRMKRKQSGVVGNKERRRKSGAHIGFCAGSPRWDFVGVDTDDDVRGIYTSPMWSSGVALVGRK